MNKEVNLMGRLVINGEEVYELDEDCLKEKINGHFPCMRHAHPVKSACQKK